MKGTLSSLKALLLLMLFSIVGVAAQADTYTYTLAKSDFSTSSLSHTDGNNVTWTFSNLNYVGNVDSNKGLQLSSSNKTGGQFTLSTSSISGTITKVTINASIGSKGSTTVALSVGGTTWGETVNPTTTATDYTFEGSGSGEILFSFNNTAKAFYIKSITVEYTAGGEGALSAPTFSESAKTFNETFDVSISAADGASIYYTTDGTDPKESDTKQTYSSAITIPYATTTLKAYAEQDGTQSDVASATYTFEPATPVISEGSKQFSEAFTVTLTSATSKADIYYTTDESTPKTSTTRVKYTEPITISATTTLKACAIVSDDYKSDVAEATYTYYDASSVKSYTYTKVTSTDDLVAGGSYLIVNESANKALGAQNSNNRAAADVTISENSITLLSTGLTANGGTVAELLLGTGSQDDTYTFYDAAESGYLYAASSSSNHLKAQSTADTNSDATIAIADGDATITFKGSNSRNVVKYNTNSTIFSCYASGQQGVQLYRRNEGSFEITSVGYATLYTEDAFVMPAGVQGGIITAKDDNNTLTIDYRYTEGKTVPAKTALLLKGDAATYIYAITTSTEEAPAENKLHGTTTDATTSVENATAYYKLSHNASGENLGFYWGADNGGAFTNKAGRAYLALNATGGLLASGFSFDSLEQTTGISALAPATPAAAPAATFDLNGRRVNANSRLSKGVYIVNGKKVIK